MPTKKVNLSKSVSSMTYRVLAADLDKLQSDNCRPLRSARVDELASDIAAKGQETPGVCRLDAGNNPILLAGQHRWQAIMQINANLEKYKVPKPLDFNYNITRVADGKDSILMSINSNTGVMSRYDVMYAIARLSTVGLNATEIIAEFPPTAGHAARFTLTPANVALALWVCQQLPESIRERVQKGELKNSALAQLKKVAQRFGMSGTELQLLADCVKRKDQEARSYEHWLGRMNEEGVNGSRLEQLTENVKKADLFDELVEPKTLTAYAKGKPIAPRDENGSARTLGELVALLHTANTRESNAFAVLLSGHETMSDEDVLRVFRVVEAEDDGQDREPDWNS